MKVDIVCTLIWQMMNSYQVDGSLKHLGLVVDVTIAFHITS